MSSYHSVLKNAQARMEEAGYGEQSALLYMLELTNKEAHNLYMEFDEEMQPELEELYEECVPADTREYLDNRNKPAATRPRKQRTVKSGRSHQTQNDDSNQEKVGQDLLTSYGMGGRNDEKV